VDEGAEQLQREPMALQKTLPPENKGVKRQINVF
jgi:hypothetical protein